MTSKIVLTRSADENAELKNKIQAEIQNAISFYEMPMISYVDFHPITDFNNYLAIIITSKYSAQRILKEKIVPQNIVFFVVGSITADLLRNSGYKVKLCADSVKNLIQMMDNENKSAGERYLYLSGELITSKMPSYVKRIIFYKVNYKESFNADELNIIKEGVDIMPLYSQNVAKCFLEAAKKSNVLNFLQNAVIIAISNKVAKTIKKSFYNVIVCDKPEEMLNKILNYVREKK